ncbi:DUF3592 domain-containing protein [Naumannella sp. ID2617S]|uniref:DUF3592 domain-containing protein n=1 Tax=Enemella dayhoffiae TaxID=2016507 RepID=A0A255H6I6_9ACTN|nr:DUF3592 domain-containing protein [Enemella dayhoffiae]NNG20821.1 DUF3592 domain-containing protein [Naumannella sp. ID2617S]OYO22763.1 hypothetical protein CGZ93_06845 [Enemella dayhoffiae]
MTIAPDPVRPAHPARVLLGRVLVVVAIGLGITATVLAVQNLYFHLGTNAVTGEVVQVQPLPGPDGQPRRPPAWTVTIEYADSNGQYRRVDQQWTTEPAPAKGTEVRIWYRAARPAEARMADLMQIWWDAVLAATGALAVGLLAEELLRRRTPATGRVS